MLLVAARASAEGIPVDEVQRRVEQQIPMRRLGEPREFAALVAFLALAGLHQFVTVRNAKAVTGSPAMALRTSCRIAVARSAPNSSSGRLTGPPPSIHASSVRAGR